VTCFFKEIIGGENFYVKKLINNIGIVMIGQRRWLSTKYPSILHLPTTRNEYGYY